VITNIQYIVGVLVLVAVSLVSAMLGYAGGYGAARSKYEPEAREWKDAFLATWDRAESELSECESSSDTGVVWEPTRDVYESSTARSGSWAATRGSK
jgi:hypothetical protein